jgi:hypothetical protein
MYVSKLMAILATLKGEYVKNCEQCITVLRLVTKIKITDK